MNRGSSRLMMIIWQLLLLTGLLVIWEVAARTGLINGFLFSKPSSIIELIGVYLKNKELFRHLGISVLETILGLAVVTVSGIGIAILLWWNKFLARLFDPFLVVINALPKTALAPVLIIWAGMGMKGIIVVAISISLVITVITSLNYFNQIEEDKIKMLQSFQATKWQVLIKLVIPSNIPNIVGIIKINIGLTWVGVIVGEFIVSRAGLGYLILYGTQSFKMDLVMMGVFVLSGVAFVMYEIVNFIEIRMKNRRGA